MSSPDYGLVLCSQFPADDDAGARFAEQLEQVRFARDAGFASVWATQHYLADPFQYLHPLAVLSRIIPESGRMRIGTAITLMALPNPVDLAEQLATLDILSGGRLVVGAGLGYRDVEFDAFGVPPGGRLRRFQENLDVVRRMWTDDEVTFANDAIKLDGVRPVLRPVQRPHPPVWLAGHTDSALRRIARTGLPWLAAATHVDTGYLRHQVDTYRAACAEQGRENAEVNVLQEIYVADTEEQAVADVRHALGVKYEAYRSWGQDRVLPSSQSFDREFDELRDGRFVLGSPSGCRARLAELLEIVRPDHVLLRPQWPGMPHRQVMASMDRLVHDVLPGAAARGGRA